MELLGAAGKRCLSLRLLVRCRRTCQLTRQPLLFLLSEKPRFEARLVGPWLEQRRLSFHAQPCLPPA